MTDSNETTDDGSTFHLELQYNDHGWGPCELSDTFNMPYQPFSKSDRMGKISDWTNSAALDKKFPSKFRIQFYHLNKIFGSVYSVHCITY